MAIGPSESGPEGKGEGEAVGSNQTAARKEPLSLDELIAKKAEAEARESKVGNAGVWSECQSTLHIYWPC